ncbi:Putative phosphatase [Salmonella bongori]|nr:Putative phosphatase [Salmonella bongori]
MKLQITALALSLTLAIPTLAQDIPLSQAESVAKSVTPDSTSAAFKSSSVSMVDSIA